MAGWGCQPQIKSFFYLYSVKSYHKTYPFLVWISTMLVGTVILVSGSSELFFIDPDNRVISTLKWYGYVFLYAAIYSLPSVAVTFWSLHYRKKRDKPISIRKLVLIPATIELLILSFADTSMAIVVLVCFLIPLYLFAFVYRAEKTL